MKIYVTERAEFRSCRRRWRYSYVLGYKPKTETPHLWFGIGIHKCLEAFYSTPERNLQDALDAWATYFDQTTDNFITEKQAEMNLLAPSMLISYAGYAAEFDDFEVVELEKRFEVPILYPKSRHVIPDTRFVGKQDMIVTRGVDKGIWVLDHKTSLAELDYRGLDVDDQVTAYCYLYWRTTGIIPEGIFYNVLLKGMYSPPTVLKNGKLSTSKSQGTNYHLFLAALKERGEGEGEYVGYLEYLKTLQPVKRYFSSRSRAELLTFEKHLYEEYREMRRCRKDDARAYPSPSATNCSWCDALSLCILQNKQEDFGWVLDQGFTVQP